MSEDRLWRWTGSTWEPARARGSASSSGGSIGILIAILVGIFILVGVITGAVIYFAGAQIVNTFSNLVMPPSSP